MENLTSLEQSILVSNQKKKMWRKIEWNESIIYRKWIKNIKTISFFTSLVTHWINYIFWEKITYIFQEMERIYIYACMCVCVWWCRECACVFSSDILWSNCMYKVIYHDVNCNELWCYEYFAQLKWNFHNTCKIKTKIDIILLNFTELCFVGLFIAYLYDVKHFLFKEYVIYFFTECSKSHTVYIRWQIKLFNLLT